MRIGYPMTLGTGSSSSYPFGKLFKESVRVTSKNVLQGDVDAVVIWGGEDISPSLYNHKVSRFTGASEQMSERDLVEYTLFNAAREVGIPIIGVCRGAQLACAASGGSLVQHVTGHSGRNHGIRTVDGRSINSNSLHHQMMFPFEVEHRLLAWSEEKLSNTYVGQDDTEISHMHHSETPEPEVVYFPQTKALAIQGHPEFASEDSPFVAYSLELVEKLMHGDL